MKFIPGKQYILWCQRQDAIINTRLHPLHTHTFSIPCVNGFDIVFKTASKPGEYFAIYQGVNGLFRLNPHQVLEAATELGLGLEEVLPYYNNECRDVFGELIEEANG